jgi:hypothetical protein
MREHIDIGLPNYISGTNTGRDKVDTYAFKVPITARRVSASAANTGRKRCRFWFAAVACGMAR